MNAEIIAIGSIRACGLTRAITLSHALPTIRGRLGA